MSHLTEDFKRALSALAYANAGEFYFAREKARFLDNSDSRIGAPRMAVTKRNPTARTLILGLASAGLYAALYLYSEELLAWSAKGQWMFVLPVAIAFIFSMVHGTFTGLFWDVLGIKAKK